MGNIRPSDLSSDRVARIHEVSFYSLTVSTWDDLAAIADALPSPQSMDDMLRRDVYQAAPAAPLFEHPCTQITKILSTGSFFYAIPGHQQTHWDLSTRLSARLTRDKSSSIDVGIFDSRFVWNEYIVKGLLDFRERLDITERSIFDHAQFIVS